MESTPDDAGGAGAASGAGETLEDLLSTLTRQLKDSDWLERTPPMRQGAADSEGPNDAQQGTTGLEDAAGGAAAGGNGSGSAVEALARALDGIARSNSGNESNSTARPENVGEDRSHGAATGGAQSPPPDLGDTLRTLLGDPAEFKRRTGPLVEYTPEDVRD